MVAFCPRLPQEVVYFSLSKRLFTQLYICSSFLQRKSSRGVHHCACASIGQRKKGFAQKTAQFLFQHQETNPIRNPRGQKILPGLEPGTQSMLRERSTTLLLRLEDESKFQNPKHILGCNIIQAVFYVNPKSHQMNFVKIYNVNAQFSPSSLD